MSIKTEKQQFICMRCDFKAETVSRMKVHINRKNQCKVSTKGIDIDIIKYKEQILDHTLETMLRCIFCNNFFNDKDLFIQHKQLCDFETMKKIPIDETEKNYCEQCHKAFKFKDLDHTIICNTTLADYKNTENERDDLEEEIKNLRMLNRKLNEELFKFAGIVNKCIDDYVNSKEHHSNE